MWWVQQQLHGEHLAINPYPVACGQAECFNMLKANIPASLSLIFKDISHRHCQEANRMSTLSGCFGQMLSYETYKRECVFDNSADS